MEDGPQRQGERRLLILLLSLGASQSRPMTGFVVIDDTIPSFLSHPCEGKLIVLLHYYGITGTNQDIRSVPSLLCAELGPPARCATILQYYILLLYDIKSETIITLRSDTIHLATRQAHGLWHTGRGIERCGG